MTVYLPIFLTPDLISFLLLISCRCVERNRPRLVENLLTATTFDHHPRPVTGEYPIHAALANGYKEVVQHIVKYAPWTLLHTCSSLQSSLHYACAHGDPDIISFLCTEKFRDQEGEYHRPDVEARDVHRRTPLHVAAIGGKVEAVKALLSLKLETDDGVIKKVDVNASDGSGRTALHLACIAQHSHVVYTLVGMASSAEERACRNQYPVANVNLFDDYERTALHYSALCSDVVCAEILLRHGADVSALGEPSTATCAQLVAAVSDPQVAMCFAEYGSIKGGNTEDARSMLSSLELANVSTAGTSTQSSSSNSSLEILSDHFGSSDSDDFAIVDMSDESSASSLSRLSPSPYGFDPISTVDASAAAAAAENSQVEGSSSAKDGQNLSLMLHGPCRQTSLSTGLRKQSSVVMAASRVSTQVRNQGVQYPKVSALTEACVFGKEDMVQLLLRYGAADDDKLAAKLTMFADVPEVVEAMLTKCHKFEKRTRRVEQSQTEAGENEQPAPAAASVSWSGLSMWSLESSWLRRVESLDKALDPIATSYQLQPQDTPCVTLYDYPALRDNFITTSSVIVHLELQENVLETVPLCIFQLEFLEALNLSSNKLKSLPTAPETEMRPAAQMVAAASNIIEEATDLLQGWRCLKLAKLKLCDNKQLEVLPRCVWFLPRLTVLEVQHAQVRSLPKFSELFTTDYPAVAPKLKILDLHDNMLDKVDGGIFYMPALEELNLNGNRLNSLPSQMWLAFKLKQLNASRNRLAKLPHVARSFKDLRSGGAEDSLPPHCRDYFRERAKASMQKESPGASQSVPATLIRVDTDRAQAKPDFLSIRGYEGSQNRSPGQPSPRLEGSFNMRTKPVWHPQEQFTSQVSAESDEGFSPMILESLDLSHNHFVSVPEVLSCLAPLLRKLNLSHNYLRSLGPIGNIPAGLVTLNLSNCKIKSGHSMDGAMLSHQHCHLTPCIGEDDGGDSCTAASPVLSNCSHRMHSCLPQLEVLNLNHNQLTRLSLGNLQATTPPYLDSDHDATPDGSSPGTRMRMLYPQLRDLSITHNRLVELTHSIGDQKDLSWLNLSHNSSLRSIPPHLGKLRGKLLTLGTEGLDLVFPSRLTHSPRDLSSFLSFLKSTLTG